MARKKMVDGVLMDLTPADEILAEAIDKAWVDGTLVREMEEIRIHRNRLLIETDWMGFSDVTLSDEWKTYRQELRDIPASNTIYVDVTWPTKPE